MLAPADLRALAQALDVHPTKRRGQNFLVDPNTVRRLVRLAGVSPGDCVLEIGPGLGSLTLGLVSAVAAERPGATRPAGSALLSGSAEPSDAAGRAEPAGPRGAVVAVEVDPVLAGALPATAAARLPAEACAQLRVVLADGLRVVPADLPTDLAAGPPTVLAANLPYNIAVPLLLGLLERFPSLGRGLVMVQAEVADRLTATPGGRVYGAPSVKLAWYAHSRGAGGVPRPVFWPQPNVDSGLVAFTRRDVPPGPPDLRAEVFAAVDAAFAQRRKTLRTALAGWAGSPARATALAEAAGVDPGARGETLDVHAYCRLALARREAAAAT
ncbi:ribosomal RNA small subunit methyltransferase A [Candidatus Frankia nodulisporulans]|uniref:ribosomal RNA small subunit methyltransferase A n=1 Tax=Candidatus Frankia nodulisporulans TaxID=2060052 RepID=UPI0013D1E887|nr:rRNA adenine dimethyltransferase family protein [Candidatus Frankia nodulisporulans]